MQVLSNCLMPDITRVRVRVIALYSPQNGRYPLRAVGTSQVRALLRVMYDQLRFVTGPLATTRDRGPVLGADRGRGSPGAQPAGLQ